MFKAFEIIKTSVGFSNTALLRKVDEPKLPNITNIYSVEAWSVEWLTRIQWITCRIYWEFMLRDNLLLFFILEEINCYLLSIVQIEASLWYVYVMFTTWLKVNLLTKCGFDLLIFYFSRNISWIYIHTCFISF